MYSSHDLALQAYTPDQLMQYKQQLSLPGTHQRTNLYGVLGTIRLLQESYPVSHLQILDGLTQVDHPCRLERLTVKSNEFLLDGSHNVQGLQALVDHVNAAYPEHRKVVIFGMFADKDLTKAKEMIYSIADEVILTRPLNPRTFNPQKFFDSLSEEQQGITRIQTQLEDIAGKIVNRIYDTEATVYVVCGSFSLSIPFKRILMEF